MFASRLSIKWLKRASSKLNKPFCLPCKGRWVQLVALEGIMKNGLDIESKPFLALFVFCSGE